MSMGSIVSITNSKQQQQSRDQQATSDMEQQVAILERELRKEKELRTIYRKRMERIQDYLKYCLQIAQDHGFLEIIITNNQNNMQQQYPLHSPNLRINITTSQPSICPVLVHKSSDLQALINQAKMNGWYIDPDEIHFEEKIGQGSTADIYKGIWRGLKVAVKCIFPSILETNEASIYFFAQEVETLSRQRHPYVLHLIGACLNVPSHAWIVTEIFWNTLGEWLHGNGNIRKKDKTIPLPSFKERILKALEISQAMQYLHEQKPKIIHRDLKPSNIFLEDNGHVRIGDFGHARFLSDEEMALTGETGTYIYMAPEVIRCEPYNEKCDVYSFGVILNELITGDHPYIETDYGPSMIAMEVAEGNMRPKLPEVNEGKLGDIIDLIRLSWDQTASVRPCFSTITSTLLKFQQISTLCESNSIHSYHM